jgi:hypothetical protein
MANLRRGIIVELDASATEATQKSLFEMLRRLSGVRAVFPIATVGVDEALKELVQKYYPDGTVAGGKYDA